MKVKILPFVPHNEVSFFPYFKRGSSFNLFGHDKNLSRISLQCVQTIAPERDRGEYFQTVVLFLSTLISSRCHCLLEWGKGLFCFYFKWNMCKMILRIRNLYSGSGFLGKPTLYNNNVLLFNQTFKPIPSFQTWLRRTASYSTFCDRIKKPRRELENSQHGKQSISSTSHKN